MNPSAGSDARVRAMMQGLPEFEPDASLWPRIESARARQRRSRVVARTGWFGAGIAAALAVVVLRANGPAMEDVLSSPDATAWQRQSAALERELQSHARTPGQARVRARLLGIDGALQAAYDRGATEDELAPLWQQRNAALRSLIDDGTANVAVVTRI